MMKKLLFCVALALCLFISTSTVAADDFALLKKRLAEAGCVGLEFVSIVESTVFDVVDSTQGTACLAADGRYYVTLGSDAYLYDGTSLYSFSAENNQVVIEKIATGGDYGQEVTFLTRLDELYVTLDLTSGTGYKLTRRQGATGDLPDSMTVHLDNEKTAIRSLSFYDANDDYNRIELLRQQLDSTCAEGAFIPAFPDSAETVKLY